MPASTTSERNRKETVSSRSRSKTRESRALGIPLTPKAARYMEKRPYAPGEHGRTKR
ncbi:MAG: 30S ribosomal protein S4, partial [Leifsonia sp.]